MDVKIASLLQPLVAAYAKLLNIEMEAELPTPDLFEIRLRVPVRWSERA